MNSSFQFVSGDDSPVIDNNYGINAKTGQKSVNRHQRNLTTIDIDSRPVTQSNNVSGLVSYVNSETTLPQLPDI